MIWAGGRRRRRGLCKVILVAVGIGPLSMFAFAVGHSSGLNEKASESVRRLSSHTGRAALSALRAPCSTHCPFCISEPRKVTIHPSANALHLSCITKSSKGREMGMTARNYLPTHTIHNQSPTRAPITSMAKRKKRIIISDIWRTQR
jgi:hypothetical protein